MKIALRILLSLFFASTLYAGPTRVSTDLGVQIISGAKFKSARKTNRARKGDRIGIYVRPQQNTIFYIVENNSREARLVHRVKLRKNQQTILPPGMRALKKGKWQIHVVAAPRGIPRLEQLFRKGTTQLDKWKSLETDLVKRGKISLGNKTDKPVSLAANVRSARPAAHAADSKKKSDPFFTKLKTYSGQSLLIKTYSFTVQ